MKTPYTKAVYLLSISVLFAGAAIAQRQRNSNLSIPDGTNFDVRVNQNLSSESSKPGDTFTGTLTRPVTVNGRNVFPQGASVTGRVVSVKSSGRLSDPGVLELTLTSIQNVGVSTQPFLIKGQSHTKSNVAKIGGVTAAGAIIGGLAGGGKGAAIGAGAGAAAGTGVAAATGKKPASVEAEAVLEFVSGSGQAGQGYPSAPLQSADAYPQEPRPTRGNYAENGRDHDRDEGDREDDDEGKSKGGHGKHKGHGDNDYGGGFADRDREVLNSCLSGYQYESLPPGIQKKLARGGSLPPGQAKKLHALPDSCNARLPRLPNDTERIIYGDRVILVQAHTKILDILVMVR